MVHPEFQQNVMFLEFPYDWQFTSHVYYKYVVFENHHQPR